MIMCCTCWDNATLVCTGMLNCSWWRCSMKSKMERLPHLAGVGASEQSFFHGTPDEATVRCICYQNFDPRMHGRHGTVYGKGVYFSTTAQYSHHYAKNSGRRFMFFARALVGKSTRGTKDLQRPPPIDPSRPHGALFDSCVDRTSKPTIVVIFDNDQCYPEFLIEYESYDKEESVGTGTVSGTVARRGGVLMPMPRSSAAAAATSPSSYISSPTSYTGSHRSSDIAAQTYVSRPTAAVRTSSAAAAQARPPSPTVHHSTTLSSSATRIYTSSPTTPVSTARPQMSPATAPARQSRNGCLVM